MGPCQDTRSRDGKTTLLRYIAAQLCTAEPPHALLSDEAPHVVCPALQTSLSVGPPLPDPQFTGEPHFPSKALPSMSLCRCLQAGRLLTRSVAFGSVNEKF